MTSTERPTTSLLALIHGTNHVPGSRIPEFVGLASAVQSHRDQAGTSDTADLTRTAAMFAILTLDADVASVLPPETSQRLGKLIGVDGRLAPSGDSDITVHPEFERAARTYLQGPDVRRTIGLEELLLAVLTDARAFPGGLFPQRLRQVGIDVDLAIDAVGALISPSELGMSGSVRQVRTSLGPNTTVTAGQIAGALQKHHPEYGGGTFEGVQLHASGGPTARTDDWLSRAAALYSVEAVEKSRHHVVDGVLILLGLAELDHSLAADLRRGGFLTRLVDEAETLPRSDVAGHSRPTPDSPATVDLLGRDPFALLLANRLRYLAEPGSHDREPYLIHLDAPWGAGKSTVLGFLRAELTREGRLLNGPDATPFLVVEINAWREQRVSLPWWTILSSLNLAIYLSLPRHRKPLSWWWGLVDRIRAAWVPFLGAAMVILAVLVGLVAVAGLDVVETGETADSILKIVSLVSAALAGLVAAGRLVVPSSRRSAKGFVDRSPNPMEDVAWLLHRSLRRARKPVVLLIDDLDRCDATYIVEFFETVQTLVRTRPKRQPPSPYVGPYVIAAADGKWLRASYEKHYDLFAATSRPGRPLGYLFQEKVFQLRTRLPSVPAGTQDTYFTSLLTSARATATAETARAAVEVRGEVDAAQNGAQLLKAASKATEIRDPETRRAVLGAAAVKASQPQIVDATEHELAPFGRFLEPNPRSMKLFVNTYGVLRSLRIIEEIFVDLGPLGLWAVIEIRWPLLADYLRTHPECLDPCGTTPEEIRALLADREVAEVLGDDTFGPLTADLIRQCAGTV